MKLKTLILSVSILFFNVCSINDEYIEIQVKDVIEINSLFSDPDNPDLVYIWSAGIEKQHSN